LAFQKSTLVPADKDVIKPSVNLPTKCVASKRTKNKSEKDLTKATMLESEKDKRAIKETMPKPKRCGQHKKADILSAQNLVVQCNVYQEMKDVGKLVQVKAMFDSYILLVVRRRVLLWRKELWLNHHANNC